MINPKNFRRWFNILLEIRVNWPIRSYTCGVVYITEHSEIKSEIIKRCERMCFCGLRNETVTYTTTGRWISWGRENRWKVIKWTSHVLVNAVLLRVTSSALTEWDVTMKLPNFDRTLLSMGLGNLYVSLRHYSKAPSNE